MNFDVTELRFNSLPSVSEHPVRVSLPPDARTRYWRLQSACENIFTAIKDLRSSYADGSLEPELRPAANLAMVAMNAHLAGDSLPRPKTDDEARQEIRAKIEQARLKGDRESYDALREGLAYTKALAKADEQRQAKRIATLDASHQALAVEKQARHEQLLEDWKDLEIQKFRRMGMKPDEAELHYKQWSQKRIEDAARKVSGVSPPPIESGVTGHGTG